MPYKDPEKRRQAARKAQAKYYSHNKEKVIAATGANRRKVRADWASYKATLSCIQCGQKHPATLDFHHIIRKRDNKKVHRLINDGAWKQAREEIKKCVVLCANCHRVHHAEKKKPPEGGSKHEV